MQFFVCSHCKNIINFFENKGVPVMCCGEKMTELVPNSTDAANEKHVPVVEKDGSKVTVTVGSVLHPMTEEHHISWIVVETNKGFHKINLDHTGEPKTEVLLTADENVVTVYEYCNLHGLWKA